MTRDCHLDYMFWFFNEVLSRLSICVTQSDDATCTSEPHVVMQMTVDDMVSLIYNYIQVGGLMQLTIESRKMQCWNHLN